MFSTVRVEHCATAQRTPERAMSVSPFRILTSIGTSLVGAAVSCAALAALPGAPVAPGASNIAIPTFTGTTPTVSPLFDTGDQSATMNGITVNFEEFAVHTSLNPADVSLGFAILTSNVPTSLDATLGGFSSFMTSVLTCVPFTSETALVCGSQTGTASRSSGMGETLTFNSMGTTAVMGVNTSNVYGILSNAPGFTKSATVTLTDDGSTFSFKGIGLSSSPITAPEPATLGLLGLGLLGTLIMRHRQPRHRGVGR
jgi:PEP-CTERM motif